MRRKAPRVRLVAVLRNDPRQLLFRQAVEEVRGGPRSIGIEPHVERLGSVERESAAARLELPRRDAEIEQDDLRRLDALIVCDRGEIAEAPASQHRAAAETREPRARS